MKPRDTANVISTLTKKGFQKTQKGGKKKNHHTHYYLYIGGKKTHVYTYFSHKMKQLSKFHMGAIKKQCRFSDSLQAEEFFDCTVSGEDYVKSLSDRGMV